jgi:hypothetical protein
LLALVASGQVVNLTGQEPLMYGTSSSSSSFVSKTSQIVGKTWAQRQSNIIANQVYSQSTISVKVGVLV